LAVLVCTVLRASGVGSLASPAPARQAIVTARYDLLMADRAAIEREMEEIRAQLDWVRDYL
jgi:hypothetical protein